MTDQLIITAKALGGLAGRDGAAAQGDPLMLVVVLLVVACTIPLVLRALLARRPAAGVAPHAQPISEGPRAPRRAGAATAEAGSGI